MFLSISSIVFLNTLINDIHHFTECNLARIISNGIKLSETVLIPDEHFSSRAQLEEFFLTGETLYLSGGEVCPLVNSKYNTKWRVSET